MKSLMIFIIFILTITTSFAQEKLTLTGVSAPLSKISQNILKEAYKKIGINIQFVIIPPARSIIASNLGQYDGETHRIKGIEKKFSNLIPVPTPINHLEIRVFSKKYNFYVDNLDNLEDYIIGIRRGIVSLEKYIDKFQSSSKIDKFDVGNVILCNDIESNFNKLKNNRVDFIIDVDIVPDYSMDGINILNPALEKIELFHYLNKKHSHLIPKLNEVIIEMKKSGEIEKIRNNYLKKLYK